MRREAFPNLSVRIRKFFLLLQNETFCRHLLLATFRICSCLHVLSCGSGKLMVFVHNDIFLDANKKHINGEKFFTRYRKSTSSFAKKKPVDFDDELKIGDV